MNFLKLMDDFSFDSSIGDSQTIAKCSKLGSEEKLAIFNAKDELNHTMHHVAASNGHKNFIGEIDFYLKI